MTTAEPGPMPAATPSLLVLDDDELVGILVETVGQLAGMATRRVLNHQAFFDALAADAPSHVVVDLTMPGMPGEDVLRRLAALNCRARIIVCSGVDRDRLAAAAELAGSLGLSFAGTLPKPFAPALLRTLLASR